MRSEGTIQRRPVMRLSRLLFHTSRAAIGCVFLLLAAAPSQAVSISVEPATPILGDNVRVIAYGVLTYWHGDGCVHGYVGGLSLRSSVPPTFEVDAWNYWDPSPVCTGGCNAECASWEGYDVPLGLCELGSLPVGEYVVRATIYGEGIVSIPFTVIDPVPVRKATWGSIKSFYR